MWRGSRVLLALVIISFPILGPIDMRGAAASTDLNDGVTQDAAEALAADMAAIREAHGWTTKQIAAYEASEAALDRLTERLWTDYPHAFVCLLYTSPSPRDS